MITPINFKLAKLLKEKGFDELCLKAYFKYTNSKDLSNDIIECLTPSVNIYGEGFLFQNSLEMFVDNSISGDGDGAKCTAPTIAEVVMWLYEKYGIWISVDMVFEEHQIGFWYCIRESKEDDFAFQSEEYKTSTEAYEAAIEYTLNNLI